KRNAGPVQNNIRAERIPRGTHDPRIKRLGTPVKGTRKGSNVLADSFRSKTAQMTLDGQVTDDHERPANGYDRDENAPCQGRRLTMGFRRHPSRKRAHRTHLRTSFRTGD